MHSENCDTEKSIFEDKYVGVLVPMEKIELRISDYENSPVAANARKKKLMED